MAKATCDHCCCCIELRKGCLIYGYLEMIGFIYFIKQLFELWNDVGPLIVLIKELSKTKISDEELEELGQVMRAVFVGVIVVLVLLSSLKIFFNIMLLIGLHKNKRGHVGAYLIYTAIFFLLGLIFLIVGITKFANMDSTKIEMPVELTIMVSTQFIQIIMSHVITVYFWMVIRSQYHLMPINRPKKFTNPMDAEASAPANRYGGPTSQSNNECRGTNDPNRSGHCPSPMRGSMTSQASDVRPEGPATQLTDDSRGINIPDSSRQCTASVDVSPVPAEVRTSQNSDENSQAENMAGNTRQFIMPPVDDAPSTSSASIASNSIPALRTKPESDVCEIELLPICKQKSFSEYKCK